MADTDLQKCVDDLQGAIGRLTAEVSGSRLEIKEVDGAVREVRDLVLKQNGSFSTYVEGHAEVHRELGKRLHGLAKADAEATGAIAVLEHETKKPSNGVWKLPTLKQVREAAYLVMLLAALAGAAWSGLHSVSPEEIKQVVVEQTRPTKQDKAQEEELKKVLKALAPLAEMLETEVTP